MAFSKKSKKKQLTFSGRPCPPSGKQIVEDIANAGETDIVFSLFQASKQDKRSPSAESDLATAFMSESLTSHDESPSSGNGALPEGMEGDSKQPDHTKLDVDTVYKQAMQFLQVTEELKSAPDRLDEQCKLLEELGAELKESIDALKRQSQDVISHSNSSSKAKVKTSSKKGKKGK